MAKNKVFTALENAGESLLVAFSYSLIKKRRSASGDLINTMESKVIRTTMGYILTISMLPYWKWVNSGVSAKNVPYGKNTGASKSKYIQGLIRWIKVKGLASGIKHIKSLAFAIAHKHTKTGIPVDKNKLGFIDDVMTDKRIKLIQQRVTKDTLYEINTELKKIIPKEI